MTTDPFAKRFQTLAKQRSPFCLGIDPTKELLLKWDLRDDATGLRHMCDNIIEAAGNRLALVKPQAAYFERFGVEGMAVLKALIEAFRAQGSLVLLDVKRGDIGSTSLAYAESYLGEGSAYQCDAMTALAYMGFGALEGMVQHAAKVGAGLFIVVRSSNREGDLLQNAIISSSGLTVANHLANEITACNQHYSGDAIGLVGAVMGATLLHAQDTLAHLGNSLLLCPGIGYQGATIADLLTRYKGAENRLIPTSSRGVLASGPDTRALRAAIEQHCDEAMGCLG